MTKRRAATRQRLLDTALDVFADQGFGRTTIEQLCEAAGYTRGAFYSNFTSLDELFLAMWEQQAAVYLAAVREAMEPLRVGTVDEAVDAFLACVPVDDRWFRLTAEFTAHALRTPSLKRVMVAREAAIAETILAILEHPLARLGRTIPDHDAFAQAMVAVHDGTAAQCVLDPDNPDVWARRRALFRHTLDAYTQEQR